MTKNLTAPGGCPCCAIAAGQAPAHIVHEDEGLIAFLHSQPIRRGHLLVIPRAHFPHFNALPRALAGELLNAGQRLAEAQRQAFKVARVGFLFPAGGVPHAQIQAVPLLSAADVTARRYSAEEKAAEPCDAELAATARHLRETLLRTVDNSVGWRPHPQMQIPHSR